MQITPEIQEALARRGLGVPTPAASQVMQPTGAIPTGGPNAPVQAPPQAAPQPAGAPQNVGARPMPARPQNAAQALSAVNSPKFDDETRTLAKSLLSKLISVL